MIKVKDVEGCKGCPYARLKPDSVFLPPVLGPGSRLVVSDYPTLEDAAKGPLTDGSGRVFDHVLRKAGINRNDLTVLNTIQCVAPLPITPKDPSGGRGATVEENKAAAGQCYRNHVVPVLRSRPWGSITSLGDTALATLTGERAGADKWRGSPLALIGEKKPLVVPTIHPSLIMKQQEMLPVVISDLKKGIQIPPENYILHPTMQEVIDFRQPLVCFDIESNRFTGQITMIGLQYKPYHVMVVPWQGPYIDEIKRIFRNATNIIGHNIIGFDMPKMRDHGLIFNPECQIWDTILMQHLLQPDLPHDLEFVSSIFTQKPAWKHLAGEDMALYCARDVDVTFQSYLQLLPTLRAQNLEDLYKYTQVPLAKICSGIERTGIRVDYGRGKVIRERTLGEIADLEKLLPEELKPYDKSIRVRQPAPAGTLGKAGKPIKFIHIPGTERVVPWNSPAAVGRWLYGTLALQEQVNQKTGKVSTDKRVLEKLYTKTKNPAIKALGEIRVLDELASNFLKQDNIGIEKVNPHLSPFGTSQGRLSSSNPNMQNQPPAARYLYVPSDPTWSLIECDFSQGENRLTAWYANDQERLQRLSQPGFSEHKLNAQVFFGVPYDEVVKDNSPTAPYGKAKKLTHGINFGEGPRKIAKDLDLPEKEVKDYLLKWRLANQPTVRWMESVSSEAERNGVLCNVFGRKRWFWSSRLYSESLSMLPQSTLADMCFRAMIGLMYERIDWPAELALRVSSVLAPLPKPARLLLQVHDSLLLEAPTELIPEVIRCVKAVMEQPFQQLGGFNLPTEASIADPGCSWGEMHSYKA